MAYLILAMWIVVLFLLPPQLVVRLYLYISKKRMVYSKRRKIVTYSVTHLMWAIGVIGLSGVFYLNSPVSPQSDPPVPAEENPITSGNSGAFPKFPWPPPAASSSINIRLDSWLNDLSSSPSLGDANYLLLLGLEGAGQYEHSYYSVPNGFALVSRLEQIDESGRPLKEPQRWQTKVKSMAQFSLGEYLKALFVAPPGYYRLIVFVVTSDPFSQSEEPVSRDTAEAWLRHGANTLPAAISTQPYTDNFICTVLIYEFEKYDINNAPIFRSPGRLSAKTHLENSGITWGGTK